MTKTNILLKTPKQIEVMREGGEKLARVKKALREAVKVGVKASEIDELAEKLINDEGGKSSFKMVPNYYWSTCVNINEGVVHGIPKPEIVFKKGDLVSVDVGMYYKGFHTDTSFSTGLDVDKKTSQFLKVGQDTLRLAISKAKIGNYIYDISEATEKSLNSAGFTPIRDLVGHGVGKSLHEDPEIPCFIRFPREATPEIQEGAVLAIEIMYTLGTGDLVLENDGWTIATRDVKISALFEDTVAVTKEGPILLTD